VVMAILIVATTVTISSVSSAYHARSLKAAETVDGMIAQSKINAMSGKKNCLIITYSTADKCYKCGLHKILKDEYGAYYDSDEAYEEQDVGNNNLHILAGGVDLIDGAQLRLEYNMDAGRIKSLKVGSETVLSKSSTDETAVITFNFYTTHSITVYKETGEHVFQ